MKLDDSKPIDHKVGDKVTLQLCTTREGDMSIVEEDDRIVLKRNVEAPTVVTTDALVYGEVTKISARNKIEEIYLSHQVLMDEDNRAEMVEAEFQGRLTMFYIGVQNFPADTGVFSVESYAIPFAPDSQRGKEGFKAEETVHVSVVNMVGCEREPE